MIPNQKLQHRHDNPVRASRLLVRCVNPATCKMPNRVDNRTRFWVREPLRSRGHVATNFSKIGCSAVLKSGCFPHGYPNATANATPPWSILGPYPCRLLGPNFSPIIGQSGMLVSPTAEYFLISMTNQTITAKKSVKADPFAKAASRMDGRFVI